MNIFNILGEIVIADLIEIVKIDDETVQAVPVDPQEVVLRLQVRLEVQAPVRVHLDPDLEIKRVRKIRENLHKMKHGFYKNSAV